ncbi:MAG: T9SS type A sorting domain-containing protein [Bacteroidota bacterium]
MEIHYSTRPKPAFLFLLTFIFSIFSFCTLAQCPPPTYQFLLGGSGEDEATEVVAAGDYFYSVGTTTSFGSGLVDILVVKMEISGKIIWSKVYGSDGFDNIKKAKLVSDGGLVISGSVNGEMLCFRINADGNLLWSKKFGAFAAYGSVVNDAIETNDGGFALVGSVNDYELSDAVIIKLNHAGNCYWSKRFDNLYGETAYGIVQRNDTLMVSGELNDDSHYRVFLMKISESIGHYMTGTKYTVGGSNLYYPTLHNDKHGGYWMAGKYFSPKGPGIRASIILNIADNFTLINLYWVGRALNSSNLRGFTPTDSGFIGTYSHYMDPHSYDYMAIYEINKNGRVVFSKKIPEANNRNSFNNIIVTNASLIAVGRKDNKMLVMAIDKSRDTISGCSLIDDNTSASMDTYAVEPFTWLTIEDQLFKDTIVSLQSRDVLLLRDTLCYQPCSQILALQNQSLTGVALATHNRIIYTLPSDKNASIIELERSYNATIFTTINKDKIPANSNEKQFEFIDSNSSNPTGNTVYYRMKIILKDGSYYYSNVLQLKIVLNQTTDILLYPNPATKSAYIQIVVSTNDIIIVNIINALGQLMFSQKSLVKKGSNSIKINNINLLRPGIYFVNVMANNKHFTKKLIIH